MNAGEQLGDERWVDLGGELSEYPRPDRSAERGGDVLVEHRNQVWLNGPSPPDKLFERLGCEVRTTVTESLSVDLLPVDRWHR